MERTGMTGRLPGPTGSWQRGQVTTKQMPTTNSQDLSVYWLIGPYEQVQILRHNVCSRDISLLRMSWGDVACNRTTVLGYGQCTANSY
jgi:hypothetical protein